MTERRSRRLQVARVLPAYQQVAEQLRLLIVRGELVAGQRLPSEAELCEMFGVSRSTVREALRVLSSQNLVLTSRGVTGGSFVAHPNPEQMRDYLGVTLGMLTANSTITVENLLEARTLLESPAARLAAMRRTDEQLEHLAAAVAMDAARADNDELFRLNWQFHTGVFAAAGNALLEVISRPISEVVRTRFVREDAPRRFWHRVKAEHNRIFEAIKAGDGATAEREMREHLEHLASTYKRIERPRPVRS